MQAEGRAALHSLSYTAANRNDGAEQDTLWHGQEKAKFGDAAYTRKADKQRTREQGVYYGIAETGKRYHPLSGRQKQKNRQHASLRAKVEHPFRVMKVLWSHRK